MTVPLPALGRRPDSRAGQFGDRDAGERTTRFTFLLHLPRLPKHGQPRTERDSTGLAGHGPEAVHDCHRCHVDQGGCCLILGPPPKFHGTRDILDSRSPNGRLMGIRSPPDGHYQADILKLVALRLVGWLFPSDDSEGSTLDGGLVGGE
jgi:hypothetical protein